MPKKVTIKTVCACTLYMFIGVKNETDSELDRLTRGGNGGYQ